MWDCKNLKLKIKWKKKGLKRIGSVKIIKRIGSSAYCLALPPTLQVHPVFHVSKLSPWEGVVNAGPEALEIDQRGAPQYEVKAILQQRQFRRKTQYLVEWEGHHPEEASWQDAEDCVGCEDLICKFKEKIISKKICAAKLLPSQADIYQSKYFRWRPQTNKESMG